MKISHVILFMLLLFSCQKYHDLKDDAAGASYIRGRLFLFDTLTTNAKGVPLANKTIKIFSNDTKDTLNFISSVLTDENGYFIFENLDKKRNYRFFYHEKIDKDVVYAASRTDVQPPIDTLGLYAFLDDGQQPGLHYTVTDGKAPLKDASICIYRNSDFFVPGSCVSAYYSLKTDAYGHAFIFNIPPGIYYATSYIEINGQKYLANDTPNVGNKIDFRNLTLTKVNKTAYNYLILDSLNTPVPDVHLCFFTSIVSYNLEACSQSNYQNSSDSTGIANGSNIRPGKYYVIANYSIDSLKFIARDTIDVIKDKVIQDTMIMHIKK